jgi:hypothetical protein
MEIFISWSGPRSQAVATALKSWLPLIINALKPWLSSTDIEKGTRWATDIASRLASFKASIICLTPSNIHSDWILFEAGALSKTVESTLVCPLLIGIQPSDVEGPLAQFQATTTTKTDILKLMHTLNKGLGEQALPESQVSKSFDAFWPELEAVFVDLPKEESTTVRQRTDREILEEILGHVRSRNRLLREAAIARYKQRGPGPYIGTEGISKVLDVSGLHPLFGPINRGLKKSGGDFHLDGIALQGDSIEIELLRDNGRRIKTKFSANMDHDSMEAEIVKLVEMIRDFETRPRASSGKSE